MGFSRRSLLLAVPLLLPVRAGAAPSGLRLETAGAEMVALTGPGVRRALLLPAAGARLLAPVGCGGEMPPPATNTCFFMPMIVPAKNQKTSWKCGDWS